MNGENFTNVVTGSVDGVPDVDERPKRKRKNVSYCETKKNCRSKSESYAKDCTLSPIYSTYFKKIQPKLSKQKKKETKCAKSRTCSLTGTKSAHSDPYQDNSPNGPCERRRISRLFANIKFVDDDDDTAHDSSDTKTENTNFCDQLMDMENLHTNISLNNTTEHSADSIDNGKTENGNDTLENSVIENSCTEQSGKLRGRKRKTTTESLTEYGETNNKSDKNNDNVDRKVRKCSHRSKYLQDINGNKLLNQAGKSYNNKCRARKLYASTPLNKNSVPQWKRKTWNDKFETDSSNVSTFSPEEGILSLSTASSDVSLPDISLSTSVSTPKCNRLEPKTCLDFDSSLSTPVISAAESSPIASTSSHTCLDMYSFNDTLDSSHLGEVDVDHESDSDEDLPVGFTPVKLDRSFEVNDVVWVKWNQKEFYPAVVKQVYKKKRRLTLAQFCKDGLEKSFTMSNKSGSILFYWDPKRSEICENMRSLSPEKQQVFRESMRAADDFLFEKRSKKDNTSLDESADQSEREADKTCESPDPDDTELKLENENNPKINQDDDRNERKVNIDNSKASRSKKKLAEKANEIKDKLAMKGQERIQKRAKQTKLLTDFMKTTQMKKYLLNIYNGKIESDLHTQFNSGSRKKRHDMKFHGFGPIDDQQQIDSVLAVFHQWLLESSYTPDVNYMLDVWYPEAVVYALKKKKRYNTKKAWEAYEKGVTRTKGEYKYLYPELESDVKPSRPRKEHQFVEIDEYWVKKFNLDNKQSKMNENSELQDEKNMKNNFESQNQTEFNKNSEPNIESRLDANSEFKNEPKLKKCSASNDGTDGTKHEKIVDLRHETELNKNTGSTGDSKHKEVPDLHTVVKEVQKKHCRNKVKRKGDTESSADSKSERSCDSS